MQDDRDEYEPIIASRPHRPPVRDEAPPLWRLVLTLTAGLAVVLVLAWWFFGRPSDRSEPTAAQTDTSLPEVQVEREEIPPARDSEASSEVAPAPSPPPPSSAEPTASAEPGATPQNAPEASASEESTPEESTAEASTPEATAPEAKAPGVVPDVAPQAPSQPAAVSLLLASPDSQVRFEVRSSLDSSPVTSKPGDVVELAPGTYRVVASGPGLETIERELELEGGGAAEFSVELCAQPEQQIASIAGQVLEQRTCASTVECESAFMILSEYAEQLVKDRGFRTQQCAKWRAGAEPEGKWTLDTKCDGEVSATTCRIEISAGACAVTGPRRTVRGETCPRAELR